MQPHFLPIPVYAGLGSDFMTEMERNPACPQTAQRTERTGSLHRKGDDNSLDRKHLMITYHIARPGELAGTHITFPAMPEIADTLLAGSRSPAIDAVLYLLRSRATRALPTVAARTSPRHIRHLKTTHK